MSNKDKQTFSIVKKYILWKRILSDVWILMVIALTLNAWPDKSSAELRFKPAQYRQFRSSANYSKDIPEVKFFGPIYRQTDKLVNMYVNDTPELPEDYFVRESNGYIDIGRKTKKDDWLDFLKTYRGIRITCLLLILLIILIPILAIIYCFCCLRCRGPCYTKCELFQRCCCSWLLLLLLLPFILGIAIAWNSNSLIDDSLKTTKEIQKSHHTDTCEFIRDTGEQIKHLFQNNFDDLKSHIENQLQNSTYAIPDEIDPQSNTTKPMDDMIKALDKMPEAKKQMLDLNELIKNATFIAIQFRDALRGVKRDLTYTLFKMCEGTNDCQNFLHINNITTLDAGCLHYDMVPNSTAFAESMEKILDSDIKDIPNDVSVRFKEVQDRMKDIMKDAVPDIMGHFNTGGDILNQRVDKIIIVLENAIKMLHKDIKIIPSNFNQLKERLGKDRKTVGYIFISILIIIAICLLIAFALGLMGTLHQWMLLVIFLIFLTLSLILIMTLYYFVMGLTLYRGHCMGQKVDTKQLRRIEIHLKNMMPIDWMLRSDPAPNVSVVEIVKSCSSNDSIYKIMNLHEILDVESVRNEIVLNVTRDMLKTATANETDQLKDIVIMTDDQMNNLTNALNNSTLTQYSSTKYLKLMCKELVHVALPTLAQNLEDLADKLDKVTNDLAIVSLRNNAIHLRAFNEHLYEPLKAIIDKIHAKLKTIDSLLLVHGKNINHIFTDAVKKVKKVQTKIRDTGKNVTITICNNITTFVQHEFDRYMYMVLAESNGQVGNCKPVAKLIRNNSRVCRALVQPFNNLWIGLLLCSLLLLPALYILHKLRCLVKRQSDVIYEDDIEHRPHMVPAPLLAPNAAAMSGFPLDCRCPTPMDPYRMSRMNPYRIITIKSPRPDRYTDDLEITGAYMLNKRKIE